MSKILVYKIVWIQRLAGSGFLSRGSGSAKAAGKGHTSHGTPLCTRLHPISGMKPDHRKI